MNIKKWARAALPAAALLMLLTGCSSLFGPSTEEEMAAVVEAVEASSSDISEVRASPAIDGLATFVNLTVTMSGDDVSAAQIVTVLAAATGAIPEDKSRINFNVRRSDGLERIMLMEQARELGVPEAYFIGDYTLALPLEWMEQNYGSTP